MAVSFSPHMDGEPPELHCGAGEGERRRGGELLLQPADPLQSDVGLPLDLATAMVGGGLVPCPGEGVGEDHPVRRS